MKEKLFALIFAIDAMIFRKLRIGIIIKAARSKLINHAHIIRVRRETMKLPRAFFVNINVIKFTRFFFFLVSHAALPWFGISVAQAAWTCKDGTVTKLGPNEAFPGRYVLCKDYDRFSTLLDLGDKAGARNLTYIQFELDGKPFLCPSDAVDECLIAHKSKVKEEETNNVKQRK